MTTYSTYIDLHDIHTYKYILVQEMNRVQQSISASVVSF